MHYGGRGVRRALRKQRDRLREELRALPSPAAMAERPLRPHAEAPAWPGSHPRALFRDADARLFLFKWGTPAQVGAEELAFRVRASAGRLHVPIVRRRMPLNGSAPVEGTLRPVLPGAGERLSPDTGTWSPTQREAILQEHPWEWLLGNLDSHADQYLLLGEDRVPVHIDWDLAMAQVPASLDRYTRRPLALVPIRNLLYDDYVRGRVPLNFRGMWREAEAIAGMPDAWLTEPLREYAERVPGVSPTAIEDAVLTRKATLKGTFSALVASLENERIEVRRAARRMDPRGIWQRFLALRLQPRLGPGFGALRAIRQTRMAVGAEGGMR